VEDKYEETNATIQNRPGSVPHLPCVFFFATTVYPLISSQILFLTLGIRYSRLCDPLAL
jgi:hypothetical protein